MFVLLIFLFSLFSFLLLTFHLFTFHFSLFTHRICYLLTSPRICNCMQKAYYENPSRLFTINKVLSQTKYCTFLNIVFFHNPHSVISTLLHHFSQFFGSTICFFQILLIICFFIHLWLTTSLFV